MIGLDNASGDGAGRVKLQPGEACADRGALRIRRVKQRWRCWGRCNAQPGKQKAQP